MTTTATAEGAGSSLDRVRLLKDLQAQARLLEDDLRERMDAEPEFRSALRVEYDKAVAAERTAAMYETWHDEPRVVQIARVGAGVLAWETHDVAPACELPIVGPALCLNMVLATRDEHVLHQFPYSEELLSRMLRGLGVGRPTEGRHPRRSPAANWCRPSRPPSM